MALNKQNVSINFSQGLDTKSDPFQVPLGKFLSLTNTVFTKAGLLQKRNGFKQLPSLPDTSFSFLTTFNGNLTAIGSTLSALSIGSQTWINKGSIRPASVDTLSLIKNNTNQTQCDSVVSSNGLVCTVYTDVDNTTPTYKYVIADSTTGQNIVRPTVIPVASGVITFSPRVFLLGNYFIIVFTNIIATVHHLQYVSINVNTLAVSSNIEISNQFTSVSTVNFDGVVANNNLYLAWNGNDGGGAIRLTILTSTLAQGNTVSFAGKTAAIMSVCADITTTTPNIYASFWSSGDTKTYTLAVDSSLNTLFNPTEVRGAATIVNVTSSAQDSQCTVIEEVHNTYTYDSSIATDFIEASVINSSGSIVSTQGIVRGLGLASKSFIHNNIIYLLAAYDSVNQPTYFLMNLSANVIAKLAYSNGGGYLTKGLPSALVVGDTVKISYLFKDLIEPVNKALNPTSINGIYTQTGINLASITLNSNNLLTSEIGNNLHLTGGFLWMYDGYTPVEHNFFVWPDNVEVTTAATGGLLTNQIYYYQAVYEWSDNQGNIFRSSPSIPVKVTTTGSNISANTVFVPTIRFTYKISNPIKIVIYRWSTAQQSFYQITSITNPLLNDLSVDYVQFVDTQADSSIIGNSLIYTTGGIVEDIQAPATDILTLYKSRLFLVDSEDRNLLWYSKQVIEATPVETSDLFTIYVAPTTSAQGNTGPITALSAMDDKLIIFKKDAIYYLTGNGPDNTGANNDFSDPIFITSTVGCANPKSIVFIPQGLMFQSDKGIWLLGRDLSTQYIGSPVEKYNDSPILSSLNIPGTNQVRFSLSNGLVLMYDYFYGQWGTFSNISSISSSLYGGLHTFINSFGYAYQENAGSYLDGSSPVLVSFATSWISLAGLQGYQRAYYFYMLAQFLSPHKIQIQIAYDFNASPSQSLIIVPDNYSAPWGGDLSWGDSTTWGGQTQLEQWRVFLQQEKCQTFQIYLNEFFDSSYGVPAGAGLTISGLNLVVGLKKGWFPIQAKNSVG